MKNKAPVTEETYIRELPYSVMKHASSLLDIDGHWKRFVILVPRRLTDVGNPQADRRYSQLQIRVFEVKPSPTKSVLDDWGTQNTRVKHMLSVLEEAALYEVTDYINVNVLHGEPTSHRPNSHDPSSLPVPQWEPHKAGADTWPHTQTKPPDANIDYENAKPGYNKEVYGAGVPYGNNLSMTEVGYYNDARSTSSSNNEVLYQRISSFDSGGQPSVSLRNEPLPRLPVEQEETLLVRSIPNQPREPCETSDTTADKENCVVESIEGVEGLTRKMAFTLLQVITDNLNMAPLTKGGRVIGCGGFGDVFLGIFENGFKVAVKRLKAMDEIERQFVTELDSLTKYRHENIVALYGYSVDGPSKCLVYEYLVNGSLEDRLKLVDATVPLSPKVRVSILQGTAAGITYLNKLGIIHRDIKSANVLLDENFKPKVGDFATARCGPRGTGTMSMNTSVVIGTSAYLAPEAMTFDISTKLDAYGFGVIILEVLTSLPPLDQTRSEKDLISFVEEREIIDVLDTSGGFWEGRIVNILMSVSDKCTQMRKKARANVEDILPELNSI